MHPYKDLFCVGNPPPSISNELSVVNLPAQLDAFMSLFKSSPILWNYFLIPHRHLESAF